MGGPTGATVYRNLGRPADAVSADHTGQHHRTDVLVVVGIDVVIQLDVPRKCCPCGGLAGSEL